MILGRDKNLGAFVVSILGLDFEAGRTGSVEPQAPGCFRTRDLFVRTVEVSRGEWLTFRTAEATRSPARIGLAIETVG